MRYFKKVFSFLVLFLMFSQSVFANDLSNDFISDFADYEQEFYIQNSITDTKEIQADNTQIDLSQNMSDEDTEIYNIIQNSNTYETSFSIPTFTETQTDAYKFTSQNLRADFSNGDVYRHTRITFKNDLQDTYDITIPIYGNTIMVRYIDPDTKEWVATGNLNNIKLSQATTLFIDTDIYSYVISVPAVYNNNLEYNTLTIAKEEESPQIITKNENNFEVKISFPQNTNFISEYWVFQSSANLFTWDKATLDTLKRHDLAFERRWAIDGYYFKTPSTYVPYSEDTLYRHPANYTGASFVEDDSNNFFKEMGYIMTKICANNQNDLGYFETGPKSTWLETDFGITYNFYDTRFNTDFARSLLSAYQAYNDIDFLKAAIKYANYFIDYAKNNSYQIEKGGILVEDYGSADKKEKTHVSLNHQLAELNFLYEIYYVTNQQSYKELADDMLLAIENTVYRWVGVDNNLNYALYYTKDTNSMVDYPYLTYNDLYQTQYLLKYLFNKESSAINYLMECKKDWMDRNNVTGYIGYVAG